MNAFSTTLRAMRAQQRLSQEELSLREQISTRHLSYLETGKSRPSREMVLRLSRVLGLPLRERNLLLHNAGFASLYPMSQLDSQALAPAMKAIDLIFERQEPYGAVLLDRCWNLLRANQGAQRIFGTFLGGDEDLSKNLFRAALHPDGLRPYLLNWRELAAITIERLQRECALFPNDTERRALLHEVISYPGIKEACEHQVDTSYPFTVIHLKKGKDELKLFTVLTTLGPPLDITAQELTIESYFPADELSTQ